MLSPTRFAGITIAFFAAFGSATCQELAPPGSGVSIHKLVIESASTRTVKYTVRGGSPKLQALVRRVEWAENELSVIEQLQRLKLDTVVYERHLAAFRTTQLTNPWIASGITPAFTGGDYSGDSESSLQRGLGEQLAYEATPQAALQMIGFLERVQTELEAQLKALSAPEKKEAQGPIDALRPRLVALTRADVSPVASRRTSEQVGPARPAAPLPAASAAIEVEWRGTWYAAEVLLVSGRSSLIHYTGWASSWDEWVPAGRIRHVGAGRGLRR